MKKDIFHSTVFKIAALMFCISFMAIISMFSSVYISDNAQTDALAINVAGSLRMQSFRMLAQIEQQKLVGSTDEKAFLNLINEFEQNLDKGTLSSQMTIIDDSELQQQHAAVRSDWYKVMKPLFLDALNNEADYPNLLGETNNFVAQIDSLVSEYQQHAESNIRNIRLIQSLALFTTLLMITFAMFIVRRHIEMPLSMLTNVSRRIGQGDFGAIAEVEGKGELTVLANTINKMSRSIQRSQSYLEEKVSRKTHELRQSNASLKLLYHASRMLNESNSNDFDFDPIVAQLAEVTGIRDIDLCLMTSEGKQPFLHLKTTDEPLPEKCQQLDCGNCTEHSQPERVITGEMIYPLNKHDINYGVLVVRTQPGVILEDWQHQLFESLVEQMATGLSMLQQQEQSRRIALMTERTVIARELHDSLAQALSYLKIQVTRLQKLQNKQAPQVQIDEVIEELRGGLNSAYRELRELLTTFRLKLDSESLRSTLEDSIAKLKARSDQFEFSLDYQVDHVPFSPQEEIHILQIAREGMQNAFYHSKGHHIHISLTMDSDACVSLVIQDDGCGIPGDPKKQNHYGLAIMEERSRSLGGELLVQCPLQGGTEVKTIFIPEFAKYKQVAAK